MKRKNKQTARGKIAAGGPLIIKLLENITAGTNCVCLPVGAEHLAFRAGVEPNDTEMFIAAMKMIIRMPLESAMQIDVLKI